MGQGGLTYTNAQLVRLLGLPPNTKILDIWPGRELDTWRLIVESPHLEESYPVPEITIAWLKGEDKNAVEN